MKEKIATILCLVMLSTAVFALISPAGAQAPNFGWIEPAYSGYDPYYDEYIVGYLEGTNWNFSMSWTNEWPYSSWYTDTVNVSAIRVYFTWGKNYTHAFSTPVQIEPGHTMVFTIYNVTASIEEAPELWTHDYAIYIHHVNSTAANRVELSPMTAITGEEFVALSADHLACLNLWSRYSWMYWMDGPSMTAAQSYPFMFSTNITKVQVLFTRSMLEFMQGISVYQTGTFGAAKTHLQLADSLFNQALTTWDSIGSAMDNATLAYTNSQANHNNALADSTRLNGAGWLLFGLGWTFIGIGIIVYGMKRPKAPTT